MSAAPVTAPRAAPLTRAGGWLVSPGFDLLFVANLPWLIVLLPGLPTEPGSALSFWQVYFLTTPHRWVTLLLVAADPDRREGRGRLFVGIAVAAALVVAAAHLSAGTFLCLAAIDLVWNGWHFAAQHAGVLRMYARKVGGGVAWLERWGLRAFVFYVALRATGWLTGFLRDDAEAMRVLRTVDLALLALPVALLAAQLRGLTRNHAGKLSYLTSVCGLYAGLLLAIRADDRPLAVALALGSALFHATEYLAIVTHYARRRDHGSAAAFQVMARNWAVVLALFVIALGSFEALWGTAFGDLWVGLNLWAAFLHYAYDGMIWKLRRPATAAALGVGEGRA